jgi:predicted alpha/beta-fold hydrolase
MEEVRRRGWRGVVMHFRSCSGEPNRQARSYCAGEIDDLNLSARHVQRLCRGPLVVVGYSLGGNALLSWLATRGTSVCCDAAVAVSVPLLLGEAATRLRQGFSQVYQWKLLRDLKRSYKRKFQNRNDAPTPIDSLAAIRDFFAYDDVITAPLHGYENVEDYYRRASSRYSLAKIKLPTLILQARDDPFMTEAVIPDPEELAPSIRFELSRFGGHVGFVSGPPWHPRYWLEERIPRFIEAQLGLQKSP